MQILKQLVLWKWSLLREVEQPAALYRLHVLEVSTLEVSGRRVFPDPECPVCGGGPLMAHWYDCPYTGLLQRSGPVPLRAHDPAVPLWFGTLVAWGPRREPLAIGGAGWDQAGAEAAGVGEAVERVQPYPLPCDDTVETAFAHWPLSEPAIEPELWVLFHPDQYGQTAFPFRPLTHDTSCRWVCFRTATTGEPCWVPEDLAFLYPREGQRHQFCPGVSTGLSCGRVGQPVLLRGLQEVIERDAVVGAWWDRYPLQEWDEATIFASFGSTVSDRLRRPNLRYRFYRVDTPFSAHVTVVTLEGEDREGFCFSVGTACRETRNASWLKATLEAVQGRHYSRYLRREPPGDGTPELRSFAEHAVFYSLHPERLPDTIFHRPRRADDGTAASVEEAAVLIGRLGEERPVLFRNLTPPPIAREIRDWYVLKVLVPGLQPLHGDDRYPHLGGPLWAPCRLTHAARLPPHPFP